MFYRNPENTVNQTLCGSFSGFMSPLILFRASHYFWAGDGVSLPHATGVNSWGTGIVMVLQIDGSDIPLFWGEWARCVPDFLFLSMQVAVSACFINSSQDCCPSLRSAIGEIAARLSVQFWPGDWGQNSGMGQELDGWDQQTSKEPHGRAWESTCVKITFKS